jgi:hypothetical protein
MSSIEDQLVELVEPTNPKFEYQNIIDDSGNPGYVNRIMIGTATVGQVRVEWMGARYTATIPVNWSQVEMTHQIPAYYPLRYQVADAQNMIVRECLYPRGHTGGAFEWLLLLEHDVVIQSDAFMIFNQYLQEKSAPIVSGLYFTRSYPSWPLVFRGRGTGHYDDWKLGDKVYVDGVPTGMLLIHQSILQLMWDESPEYQASQGQITRRVFNTPREIWHNPETGWSDSKSGTSDLEWCSRITDGDYLRRAGWNKYLDELPDPRYPFIVDTRLFAQHIEKDGTRFPPQETLEKYMRNGDVR